jgi:hypothetical protein
MQLLQSEGHDSIYIIIDWLTKMEHFGPCKSTCTSEQLLSYTSIMYGPYMGFLCTITLTTVPNSWPHTCTNYTETLASTKGYPQHIIPRHRVKYSQTTNGLKPTFIYSLHMTRWLGGNPSHSRICIWQTTSSHQFACPILCKLWSPPSVHWLCNPWSSPWPAWTLAPDPQNSGTMSDYPGKCSEKVQEIHRLLIRQCGLCSWRHGIAWKQEPKYICPLQATGCKMCGPLWSDRNISPTAYRLNILAVWQVHNVFHASLNHKPKWTQFRVKSQHLNCQRWMHHSHPRPLYVWSVEWRHDL